MKKLIWSFLKLYSNYDENLDDLAPLFEFKKIKSLFN
jgi:hypothetical protein